MTKPMQPPRFQSSPEFRDRVPVYWKHGAGVQAFYDSFTTQAVLVLFNLSALTFMVVSVVGMLTGMDLLPVLLLWLPMLVTVPHLMLSAYLKLGHAPLPGAKAFKNLRVNEYRALPAERQQELKPMLKKLWENPKSVILQDYQFIIDNQPKLVELEQIPTKLKARIEVEKERIAAAQMTESIMREKGWDKELA